MNLQRFMPRPIRKLLSLSKHQLKYELRSNLWFICVIYALIGIGIAGIAYWIDISSQYGESAPAFFSAGYSQTSTIVSSLIAGSITLNAFTLNSILVVLTNFSGQFTPRMLVTFVADKRTQHVLGMFNLVFVFILMAFFLIDANVETYVAFPTLTIIFMFLGLATFIYFLNHAVNWMQVPNLTLNMKSESQERILATLVQDLEPYRTKEPNTSADELPETDKMYIAADGAGFVQIIDYRRMVSYAEDHNLVVKLERRIGDFVLEGIPVVSYWKKDNTPVDENALRRFIFLGSKKTEVQDIEFGINKLKEIAIKSIGNDDPNTASNAIYQLTDLLLSISKITRFTPYLTDTNNDLRVIIEDESFDYYLYAALAHISIYAKSDPIITNDVLEALALLTESVAGENHEMCWNFAAMIARGYISPFVFEHNEKRFYASLRSISETTDKREEYRSLEEELRARLTPDND